MFASLPFPLAQRGSWLLLGAMLLSAMLLGACAAPVPRPTPPPPASAPTTTTTTAQNAATPAPQTAPRDHADPPVRAPAASPDAALTERIAAFINQPRFRHASWGIRVVDLNSGALRYAHNARKLFVPASNTKLYTAALALATLGPEARFTTRVVTRAPRRGPVLAGNLVLRGGGDPALGDRGVAPASVGWADAFAAAVARQGITTIGGDLVADLSYFHGAAYGHGWEANDLAARYAPPVTALSADGNLIAIEVERGPHGCCQVDVWPQSLNDFVVNLTAPRHGQTGQALVIARRPGERRIRIAGSLPQGRQHVRYVQAAPSPPRHALAKLRRALAARGIHVNGRLRIVRWPATVSGSRQQQRVLASISSPPLRLLVHEMLKHSNNLIAQTLLLQVGVHQARAGHCRDRKRPPVTTEAWGLCAMRAMLRRSGIGTAAATFSEGSGLSRHDLVTPTATTRLLRWVRQQDFAGIFMAALPVAGVDGTLEYRLGQLPPGSRIRAKTGTLSHVYALSGYATDVHGQRLAFSIMLNRYQRPRDAMGRATGPSPDDDLDRVARMIVATPR